MNNASASRLADATQRQSHASDPAVSAWVRANAGTGKTHVLVQRILRLLLSGAEPRSILCLTFTKNAAAEMEARVLKALGDWTTATTRDLESKLAHTLGREPKLAEIDLARCLFATVVDVPGGLPMMTIHAFCERILRRFSLEAGVPPGFTVLTDDEARDALAKATATALQAEPESELATLAAYANEADFPKVLNELLAERTLLSATLSRGLMTDPIAGIEIKLRWALGLKPGSQFDSIVEEKAEVSRALCHVLDDATLSEAVKVLSSGSENDTKAAARFSAALRSDKQHKIEALRAAFCTQNNTPRASLMTAPLKKRAGLLEERLAQAQTRFCLLDTELCALRTLEATCSLLRLANTIFQLYDKEKRDRAAVDFEDLTDKTLKLLSRSEAADWVLHQLDARIDHIMVDEAQDTSPVQWAIIERLAADFFAGESARETAPTIFAVGDEKQSIYGFQGADPELLRENGAFYKKRVVQARLEWRDVDLNLSFRTLQPVLDAVDAVCPALPGLRDDAAIPHLAHRDALGGFVEVWEAERGQYTVKGDVWAADAPTDAAPKPSAVLAERIAETIAGWLDKQEALGTGKSIAPGDILILLRKREPMASLLQAALRKKGIPVAGTDRVALLEELAVMDMMALADWALLPDDDLSLAVVLKSPLIGFDEDELYRLAYGRTGSLWSALQESAQTSGRHRAAYERLDRWYLSAANATPIDFMASVLAADRARTAFAARLGPQCHDALDELIAVAETFAHNVGGDLSAFLAFIRNSASEVKRETGEAAGDVRIMTIHGAKGLEAPIVFLADTCSKIAGRTSAITFMEDDAGFPLPVWSIKGASGLECMAAAREVRAAAETREMARLLYVGMTRARDRLYVAGFHANGEKPKGCWHETVFNALLPNMAQYDDESSRKIWRLGTKANAKVEIGSGNAKGASPLPEWLKASFPYNAPAPLGAATASSSGSVSSRIHHPSAAKGAVAPAPMAGQESRFDERAAGAGKEAGRVDGLLIHRLLEILPQTPTAHRLKLAEVIASAFAADLTAARRQRCIRLAAAALDAPAFKSLWSSGVAEADLILAPSEDAQDPVVGRADRVAFNGERALLIDYKSGRQERDAAQTYSPQLHIYGDVLQRVLAGKDLQAALLVLDGDDTWKLIPVPLQSATAQAT